MCVYLHIARVCERVFVCVCVSVCACERDPLVLCPNNIVGVAADSISFPHLTALPCPCRHQHAPTLFHQPIPLHSSLPSTSTVHHATASETPFRATSGHRPSLTSARHAASSAIQTSAPSIRFDFSANGPAPLRGVVCVCCVVCGCCVVLCVVLCMHMPVAARAAAAARGSTFLLLPPPSSFPASYSPPTAFLNTHTSQLFR